MSDEDALLAAITANPDEDTPRLAYADWLDENADAVPDPDLARVRAEFIRVQVERLRCPYWLPDCLARYSELSQREHAIQNSYTAAILGLASEARGIEVWFSRGFPCLRMDVGEFLAHAHRFEQLRPPVLTVTGVADQWYDLITHPHLPLVTNLTMNSAPSYPQALDASIVGRLGELGGRNRLRGLDLRACQVGDTGLAHLAEHADVWRLEELDLSHNDIQYAGLVEVLVTSIPDTLRRVNLCGNPITDLGAKVLAARWPANGPLKWLRLEGTRIGPTGRQALRDRFGEKVELEPDV